MNTRTPSPEIILEVAGGLNDNQAGCLYAGLTDLLFHYPGGKVDLKWRETSDEACQAPGTPLNLTINLVSPPKGHGKDLFLFLCNRFHFAKGDPRTTLPTDGKDSKAAIAARERAFALVSQLRKGTMAGHAYGDR